jgi:murein DD-endopeptidase MepM/ murein hydrolase activator NlpD
MRCTFKLILENRRNAKAPNVLKVNTAILYLIAVLFLFVFATATMGVYYTVSLVTAKSGYHKKTETHLHLAHTLDSLGLIVAQETEFVAKFSDVETELSIARGLTPAAEDTKKQSVGGRVPFSEKVRNLLGSPIEMKVSEMDEEIAGNKRQLDFLTQRLATINEMTERQRMFFAEKPSVTPATGRATSEFGARNHPVLIKSIIHEGIDIANAQWTPIIATADGIVSFSGVRGCYGIKIDITHRSSGYLTRYAHLVQSNVNVGDIVRRGDVIAYMGSTGMSTGSHLHYEVRRGGKPINPRDYMIDAAAMLR